MEKYNRYENLFSSSEKAKLLRWIDMIRLMDLTYEPRADYDGRDITENYFDKIKCDHVIYMHDSKCQEKYSAVIEQIKQGSLKVTDQNSLKKLHYELFSPNESAGEYNKKRSVLRHLFDSGDVEVVFQFAKVEEREAEIDLAFELYYDAIDKEKDLSLVYIQCLANSLMTIHPFNDGNGRAMRLAIISLMYNDGFKHIVDVGFERKYKHFYSKNKEYGFDADEYRKYVSHMFKQIYNMYMV